MEYSPPPQIDLRTSPEQESRQHPRMSILTMSAPSPYHTFENELPWDEHRPASGPSRPRMESKQTALPSIRQVSIRASQFCKLKVENKLKGILY